MEAAPPFVHATLPTVRKDAELGYEPSLHLKEKLEIVEPGHVISKGPTRDDALPEVYTVAPVASKTSCGEGGGGLA